MQIYINNPNALELDVFIKRRLIPTVKELLLANLNLANCYRWTRYFKNKDLGWIKYKKKVIYPSAYNVIVCGIDSITYCKQGDNYIIQIDKFKNLPRSTAKLNDLCCLIDCGNLEVSPYPIFSEVFRDIDRNLNQIYDDYIQGDQ